MLRTLHFFFFSKKKVSFSVILKKKEKKKHQILYLLNHVDLDQSSQTFVFVLDSIEFVLVQAIHVLNVAQPVVNDAERRAFQRRAHTSAIVVTAHNDVTNLFNFILKVKQERK